MKHFNEVNRHTVGAVTCSCSLNPKRCFPLGQVISQRSLVHTFLISQVLIQSNTSRCTILVWPNAAVLGFLRLSSTWYDFTPSRGDFNPSWCDLPLALVRYMLKKLHNHSFHLSLLNWGPVVAVIVPTSRWVCSWSRALAAPSPKNDPSSPVLWRNCVLAATA